MTSSPQGDGNLRNSDRYVSGWANFMTSSPQGDGNLPDAVRSQSEQSYYFMTSSPQGDGNLLPVDFGYTSEVLIS